MDDKRDMTKAFDSIRHDILLAKLRRIGISSSALVWFSSYLSDRKQVVRRKCRLSEIGATLWRPPGIHFGSCVIHLIRERSVISDS